MSSPQQRKPIFISYVIFILFPPSVAYTIYNLSFMTSFKGRHQCIDMLPCHLSARPRWVVKLYRNYFHKLRPKSDLDTSLDLNPIVIDASWSAWNLLPIINYSSSVTISLELINDNNVLCHNFNFNIWSLIHQLNYFHNLINYFHNLILPCVTCESQVLLITNFSI